MGRKHSNGGGSGWSINKVAFWTIVIIALMYLVAGILHLIDANKLASIVNWVRAVASAVALCLVAVLAFRYVRNKPTVWMILYIIVLLIVLVFIVLPVVL